MNQKDKSFLGIIVIVGFFGLCSLANIIFNS